MRYKICFFFLAISCLYAETEFESLCKRDPEFAHIHANPPRIESAEEEEIEKIYRLISEKDPETILKFARHVLISNKVCIDDKSFSKAIQLKKMQ